MDDLERLIRAGRCHEGGAPATWTVQHKTGPRTWSTTTYHDVTLAEALRLARRDLGGVFASVQ